MLSTTVRNRSRMGNLGAPRRMRTVSTQASAKRVVTIFSDSICPWCWVGKRNLDNAIALLPEDKRERFTLRWAPYLLGRSSTMSSRRPAALQAALGGRHEAACAAQEGVTHQGGAEGVRRLRWQRMRCRKTGRATFLFS